MKVSPFNDRVERKYQIAIDESEVGDLWRNLKSFLGGYGLIPAQEITSVGSVYFDNKDCDLLRFCLLGHLMLFRVRAYERFGQTPQPINEYWVEVKTANGERRHKRRFPLSRSALSEFLAGKEFVEGAVDHKSNELHVFGELYRESQEILLTMGLSPMLLVTCKRLAFQGEMDRISLDWDVRYYRAGSKTFNVDSWKYLNESKSGMAEKVILELKYLRGDAPPWFAELQRKYPIRRREYLKPVEGMGYLFRGPLKEHEQANFLLPMINAYMRNSLLG